MAGHTHFDSKSQENANDKKPATPYSSGQIECGRKESNLHTTRVLEPKLCPNTRNQAYNIKNEGRQVRNRQILPYVGVDLRHFYAISINFFLRLQCG